MNDKAMEKAGEILASCRQVALEVGNGLKDNHPLSLANYEIGALKDSVKRLCYEIEKIKSEETVWWHCSNCGTNERPMCHKCVSDKGELVADELVRD